MKYKDWYNKYVGNSVENEIAATKSSNNKKAKPQIKDFTTEKEIPLRINNKDTEYYIEKGAKITDVEVIAGKGVNRHIDDISRLINMYKKENNSFTNKKDWQKLKGITKVRVNDALRKAEIHWYQCESIGKVEVKIKRWLDES